MDNVLITSKEFGKMLGDEHWNELTTMLESNHCNIIINPLDRAMTADDIVAINARTPLAAIAVYSSSDEINHRVFEECDALKVVSRHGVGIENIDLTLAKQRGVEVLTTAKAKSHEAVADLTFSLILSLARGIVNIDKALKRNEWYRPISHDVWGKTLGIIGLGRIGRAVSKRAQGFSMKVVAYDPYPDNEYAVSEGISMVSLSTLIEDLDFISLHCGLSSDTEKLIGEKELASMKESAFLINTARSGLVDQAALIEALKSKKIAGAGIDVFDVEPPVKDPLLDPELGNLIVTSHVGAYTWDSIRRMDLTVVKNIVDVLNIKSRETCETQQLQGGHTYASGRASTN